MQGRPDKPRTRIIGADSLLTRPRFSLWPAAGGVRGGFIGPRFRMKTAKDASNTKARVARMAGCCGYLGV